jgi:membrane-associated phospholipid phosphatase
MPAGRQRSHRWSYVALGCAVALSVSAVLVATRWHPLISLDRSTSNSAHRAVLAHHWLEQASRELTKFGDPRVIDLLAVAGAAAAATRRRWDLAIVVVVVRLLELGVNTLTKVLVERPRPSFADPVTHAAGASFPSGHAAGTTAMYAVLLILFVRAGNEVLVRIGAVLVALLVVCVAATRVLLGVHYPSDVAAGILVGIGALAATRTAFPAR